MRNRKQYISSLPQYGLGSWLKGAVKDVGEFTGLKKVADFAGDVVGKDIRSGVKGFTGGVADVAGDYLTYSADNALGLVGAGNVIGEDAYETKLGAGVSNITSNYVMPAIGMAGATAIAGPMGGAMLGGVQKGVGSGIAQKQQLQQQRQMMQQQQAAMNKQSLTQNRLNSYNRNQGYNYAPTFKTGGMLNSYPNGGTIQGLGIGQLPTETVEAPTKFDTRPVYRQHFAKMSPEQIDAVRRQSNATTNEDLQEAFNRLYTKGPNTQYLAGNNSVYQMTRRGEPLYQQVERSPGMGNYRDIDFNNAPLSDRETLDIYNEQYESVYPDKNSYLNQMNLQREVAGFADIPGLNLGMGNRAGHEYYTKADGGYLEQTRYNPDITAYNSGGSTHETSPYGGIPIGNKGSVESGEVRYGDYIFSDRF
jgi:hypothetical protein